MRNTTKASVIAVLAAVTCGASLSAQTRHLELQPDSKLWIEGTSTVHGWKCSTSKINGLFDLGTKGNSVLDAGALTRVDVDVPVRSLDCGHGKMNRNMFDALGADAYPSIKYSLIRYELVPGTATKDSATVRAIGSLQISGTTKEVTMDVRARREGQIVRAEGKVALLMTDYGVKPPVVMAGLLKTGNQITVNFDIRAALSPVVALAWDNAIPPVAR